MHCNFPLLATTFSCITHKTELSVIIFGQKKKKKTLKASNLGILVVSKYTKFKNKISCIIIDVRFPAKNYKVFQTSYSPSAIKPLKFTIVY